MKFRRKSDKPERAENDRVESGHAAADPPAAPEPAAPASAAAAPASADDLRANGPWDISEVTIDEADDSKIDLGSLIVTGKPGLELRLQVDEASQQVAAVLLLSPEGAVELRPFAAPRNGDIWGDIREAMVAEATRRGGTAKEADGVWGKELRLVVPVQTPDGKSATQPSRVFGIPGPRWLLRATYLGKPALEPHQDGLVESALRDVVVVRGAEAMAPGDPLPLRMPGNAQRTQSQQPEQPQQPGQPLQPGQPPEPAG